MGKLYVRMTFPKGGVIPGIMWTDSSAVYWSTLPVCILKKEEHGHFSANMTHICCSVKFFPQKPPVLVVLTRWRLPDIFTDGACQLLTHFMLFRFFPSHQRSWWALMYSRDQAFSWMICIVILSFTDLFHLSLTSFLLKCSICSWLRAS